MKRIRVVDLFSGVGGLSYGFYKNPMFEIVFANEIDPDMAKAYKLNHPDVEVLNQDIQLITKDYLNEQNITNIDLVVGGPPCQSYSTVGKRIMDDRANLFYQYYRMLKILDPKMFIYENVSGLLSMNKGELFPEIKELFSSLGYKVKHKILNSADYGVPQERQRVIIVGSKVDNDFNYPEIRFSRNGEFGLEKYLTVEQALSDLPELVSGQEIDSYSSRPKNDYQKLMRKNSKKTLKHHSSPKNNDNLIKLMQALPDGGTKKDLPEELRPKSGYGNTYAKLWWKRPATTITRNFGTPSSSRCIHPTQSRALSTREGARLQSFPDDFQFYGSRSKMNLQIGNAVPPLLSVYLAESVLKTLTKGE